jgi:hypothetical protein
MGAESPQQSDNEEEEEDDDDDDDGTPSYMLSYDPVPGVFNLAHAIYKQGRKVMVVILMKKVMKCCPMMRLG